MLNITLKNDKNYKIRLRRKRKQAQAGIGNNRKNILYYYISFWENVM